MCERSPGPRCRAHTREALEEFDAANPALTSLGIQQLRTKHSLAIQAQNITLTTRLREALDLRLDADSTSSGLRDLGNQMQTGSRLGAELWWRYQAGQAAAQARREYAQLQPRGRRADIVELGAARERLVRLEARAAADLATGRSVHQRDTRALRAAHEAVLAADAHHRYVTAKGQPDPKHLTPAEHRRWGALTVGREESHAFDQAARKLAILSHERAAIATWRYPHRTPEGGHRSVDRARTINPLEGARVAILTNQAVRCDTPGAIHVDSTDPAVRERLWRAGYLLSSPTGTITIRAGNAAAA